MTAKQSKKVEPKVARFKLRRGRKMKPTEEYISTTRADIQKDMNLLKGRASTRHRVIARETLEKLADVCDRLEKSEAERKE